MDARRSESIPVPASGLNETDARFVAFLQWALPRLGLRWPGFRKVRGQVRKRIARRMQALGLHDLDAYRARLGAEPSEWAELDRICRIPISRFHRDRAIFEHVRRSIVPELAELAMARGERSIVALSAGCASGEEPYTVAMIGVLELSSRFPALALEVVAVDADERLLARAARGCYEAGSLRELPAGWLDRAFEPRDGLFCVREEIRRRVDLRCADIRAALPDGPFHLVLCRNLAFTYFDEPAQRAVAARIADRLVPGGALVLGCHETLPERTPGFSPGPPGTHTWRRTGGGATPGGCRSEPSTQDNDSGGEPCSVAN